MYVGDVVCCSFHYSLNIKTSILYNFVVAVVILYRLAAKQTFHFIRHHHHHQRYHQRQPFIHPMVKYLTQKNIYVAYLKHIFDAQWFSFWKFSVIFLFSHLWGSLEEKWKLQQHESKHLKLKINSKIWEKKNQIIMLQVLEKCVEIFIVFLLFF